MKHLSEAQKLVQEGSSLQALDIIDSLLELAPKNPDALRLKARILDAWGYFDKSFEILKRIAFIEGAFTSRQNDIEDRIQEDREGLIFSELTSEGRWYFAFPKSQVWISLVGFTGCATFLLISSTWIENAEHNFEKLLTAFFFLVLCPWVALIISHFTGIKRILVGIEGIKVCSRFKEKLVYWHEISSAVIEYDINIQTNYLFLHIYSKNNPSTPVLSLNISPENSVIKARRHFLKAVIAHLDAVVYRSKQSLERNLNIVPEPTSTIGPIGQVGEVEKPTSNGNKVA